MAARSDDPRSLPIDAISTDPAIAASQLSADRLRQIFRDPQTWVPEVVDEQRFRTEMGSPVAAAVLIAIVVRVEGLSVLLTKRTDHLLDHAGQVSFPGGRTESEDASVTETALRETEEEIGLERSHIEIIGHLPDYYTGTGYRISPIVGLVRTPFTLQPDPFEVAEAFEVPLEFLMDPSNHQTRRLKLQQGDRAFYAMPFENHFIWGATAGMLRNLYRFLWSQIGG